MRTQMDYSGTSEAGNFDPAPSGVYRLRIYEHEDGKTQDGKRDKVTVQCRIVNDCPQRGKDHIRHQVTIIPGGEPGAGFCKHFLRVIGQPFEGRFTIDSDNWDDKEFIARLGIEEYKNKNGEFRKKNIIEETWNISDEDVPSFGEFPDSPKTAKDILKDRQREKNPNAETDEVPF